MFTKTIYLGVFLTMRVLVILLLFVNQFAHAQTPGNALEIGGTGQFVTLDDILGNVRTITFWMQLTTPVTASNPQEIPIIVRDENSLADFAPGEFAIYFGAAGTPQAGHLVIIRASTSTAYSIKSNQNSWHTNRWYHIAVVCDNATGLKLYVNGIQQQETNANTAPIYNYTNGTTYSAFLGKWGYENTTGLNARFDELRFYYSALSQNSVREMMCKVEATSNINLIYYFNFDNASNNILVPTKGAKMAICTGIPITAIKKSNAPVGQNSDFLYNLNSTSILTAGSPVAVSVKVTTGNPAGVHIYQTNDFNLNFTGSYPIFFGVWYTDTAVTYQAEIDYTGLGSTCDSCAEIRSREFQTSLAWMPRTNVYPQNCKFTLPNESPGKRWREEYWLLPSKVLKSGLPDTIWECEGTPVKLSPTYLVGAKYLWENDSTIRERDVDSAGYYSVTIKWKGCTINAGVWVIHKYTPFFELPKDTAICIGDTLVLTAPLIIDSAKYVWAGGDGFGHTYRIYHAGIFTLTIKVGGCSYTDAIKVDIVKNFPLYFGPDDTLCLGEERILKAPPNTNFVWSTGETTPEIRVLNQSQHVWLRAWNACFSHTDTIGLFYEDCACYLYMANTFTPNNDGKNDVYMAVSGCKFAYFELNIFNRWGEKVFATNDISETWDGNFKGQPAPEGVYTYQLRYQKFSQYAPDPYEFGTINLVR